MEQKDPQKILEKKTTFVIRTYVVVQVNSKPKHEKIL